MAHHIQAYDEKVEREKPSDRRFSFIYNIWCLLNDYKHKELEDYRPKGSKEDYRPRGPLTEYLCGNAL